MLSPTARHQAGVIRTGMAAGNRIFTTLPVVPVRR